MTKFLKLSKLFPLAIVLATSASARADLYGYVDETGRAHFSTQKLDERYTLFKRTVPKTVVKKDAVTVAPSADNIPTKQVKLYNKQIQKIAKKYQIDPALLHAVILSESQYNPEAVSQRGAAGLMQLMPDTALRYKVADVFDPTQNIRGGAQYLRDLLRLFNNNMELTIAAYNAGENAVIKSGWRIPPYAETIAYVPKVMAFYRQYLERI
ncbi:MAG: lytic transglycosylase domain-containing protein [Burkholderiales bacterium]